MMFKQVLPLFLIISVISFSGCGGGGSTSTEEESENVTENNENNDSESTPDNNEDNSDTQPEENNDDNSTGENSDDNSPEETPSNSGTPNEINQLYSSRVLRIEFDYENNGITDGAETYEYYENGLLERTSFAYSGDGTPDGNAIMPYLGTLSAETIYEYDELGRLIDVSRSTTGNTSPEATQPGYTGSITTTFTYSESSVHPSSKTTSNFNDSGQLTSTNTIHYNYNGENKVTGTTFEYDSPNTIDNPAFTSRQEYIYDSGSISISSFNYLDEFSVAFITLFNENGLISTQYVTTDSTIPTEPAPNTSVTEHLYNDRGCWSGIKSGTVNESGNIDYYHNIEITYDNQDRATAQAIDSDADGNIDARQTIHYEESRGSRIPYPAFELQIEFINQGKKTSCLTD